VLHLRRMLAVALLAAVAGGPAVAGEVAEGNWKLSFYSGPTAKTTYYLLGVQEKDGKTTAELVAVPPRINRDLLGVKSFAVKGKKVQAVLKFGSRDATFEGTVRGKDKVLGSFAFGRSVYPAEMRATDQKELTARDRSERLDVPPMTKASTLNLQPRILRIRAARAKDPEEKAKLLKQAEEASKEARQEVPRLYEEVLQKHADSTAVFAAATGLLAKAAERGTTPEQAGKWADVAAKAAAPFGERFTRHTHAEIAGTLLRQKGMGKVALEHARAARKLLPEDADAKARVGILKTLHAALAKVGRDKEAAAVKVDLDKVQAVLDKEYHEKVPPFKVTKFKGREGKSDRAVVMELFTGAQCPPCVAADVAFDALQKAYKPGELILIQYHLHIPGPDPLTNRSTLARADYYKVRSTPNTFFNGKPQAGGGGGMARAEAKFDQYREIIDPLLEKEPGAELNVKARRKGDKIAIEAKVSGVKEPGEAKRLRLLLVEESIRYVGGNDLRFHHQVVRDLPGGAEGFALKKASSKHTAEVDLKELRKRLAGYLDEYAKERAFPYSDRPLALKGLRVIALVQDNDTHEILQGVQVEVEE
jgi:hypothetical protein